MQQQVRKVEAHCEWTGMILNPLKSEILAILQVATSGRGYLKVDACNWDIIQLTHPQLDHSLWATGGTCTPK